MQQVYYYFLESVTSHVSDLMRLLGDEWPSFRDRLLKIAMIQLTESELSEAIVEAGLGGPADDLIQQLMRDALARAGMAGTYRLRRDSGATKKAPKVDAPLEESAAALLIAKVNSIVRTLPGQRREITVTGHTLAGAAVGSFKKGEMYRLRCRVDAPTAGSLATGKTAVEDEDVPAGGLKTRWILTSSSVEFVPSRTNCKVEKVGNTWRAEFDLLIPEKGASEVKEVVVVGPEGSGTLLVTLDKLGADGSREHYRELTVSLTGAPAVTADEISKLPQYTDLKTTHEWTTPWEHIQVSLNKGLADIGTTRHALEIYEFVEPFDATDTFLIGAIENVRQSLENFREVHEAYLESLDADDMRSRLKSGNWRPYLLGTSWCLPDGADPVHKDEFAQVRQTDEWRALASDGYALFDRCFPEGTKLRALLTKMMPGNRIDFHWTEQSGAGVVSHVPWALMYMEPVDVTGHVLPDPEKFFGLRFRIGSRSWRVNNGSVVLGGLDKAHAMAILYWGRQSGDDVGVEAEWQSKEYANSKLSTLLPDVTSPNLKQQIVRALDTPGPSPVAVIYFYCHCSVGDGAQPCLRFGNTSKRDDTIGRIDLSARSIPDGPLIFANACNTSHADPHMTSELEQAFFKRGARAFIGTETKVPIKLASKFAWLYFQFFYRNVDPTPMAAGEALTQARLFLWTQYKNVGGLFYSMSNQYDLYLASQEEVLALRA